MFWERFFELCNNAGIKPSKLCIDLGFSNATATHWKNGKMPNADALMIVADHFNVSADYLLGRTDIPEIKSAAPIQFEDKDGFNVILLAGRNGQQIKLQLTDEQYDMIYKMFCSFPDADNPDL